ncbi:MAG: HDOD domain-containing protein [Deltaproteobacteria bacterium]|nr:HDOD domain-containing protein [Deltaproteobacteria bacterium]
MDNDKKQEKIKALLEQVEQSEISSIKSVVSEIVRVINDPRSNAMDLKEVIEIDPPLTARVLKAANSAYYAPPKRIDDIRHAILWIGSDALKELALSQKVCQVFEKSVSFDGYSRTGLWTHSLAAALFAKALYRREFAEAGENAYAAGLLHDIGVVIEDQFLQDAFRVIIRKAKKENKELTEIEVAILGYSHADIGGALSEYWNFPEELVAAIRHHHDPAGADELFSRMASTLYLADYVCTQKGFGYIGGRTVYDKDLYLTGLKQLNIRPQAIKLIAEELEQEMRKMQDRGVVFA